MSNGDDAPRRGGFEPYPSYPGGGSPQPRDYPPVPGGAGQKTNGMAIGALVAGIAGLVLVLFLSPLFGAILGIVALVLGIIARKRLLHSGEKGRGFAIAGFVLGIIDIVVFVLFIVAVGVFLSTNG